MALSVFDLLTVGVGPSSSHTVGPMRAAVTFVRELADGDIDRVTRVRAELFGSLGLTGEGHASDTAVLMGLEGAEPETVDPQALAPRIEQIREGGRLRLGGRHEIAFNEDDDLILHQERSLPVHPNGMTFTAYDSHGAIVDAHTYYSIGGGFVVTDEGAQREDRVVQDETPVAHPFLTGDELLAICAETGLSIAEVMFANERFWRSEAEIRAGLLHLRDVMFECIDRGLSTTGTLPGGLNVQRRAPQLLAHVQSNDDPTDPMRGIDWVEAFALAVNEENAAGGRVVTAPTNGAAGIIPAVLRFHQEFVSGADDDDVVTFLLTAGAIGVIYKENASISGAEVGCQGEVGSACSMAAGAMCAVLGGTPVQIEQAAEIGMEHNLGLTCDPVGGLVQIPCIERNAIASVKAIAAARTAMLGDGSHIVSLDTVVKTMRDIGADMQVKYKETSRGGLAVNVIFC